MADVTVSELANMVGVPEDRLLEQIEEAGLPQKKADDTITNDERATLLLSLKSKHGEDTSGGATPRRITLKRKTVETLKSSDNQGRSKAVNVEVRKKRLHRPQLANRAALNQFLRLLPLRMVPKHEGFHQLQFRMPTSRFHQFDAFGCGQADRFFAQHMLARFQRANRPRHMQMIRQRIVNRINVGIGQQLLIRAIRLGDSQFASHRSGSVAVARAYGGHVTMFPPLHGGNHFLGTNIGSAENTPTDFCHGCENLCLIVLGNAFVNNAERTALSATNQQRTMRGQGGSVFQNSKWVPGVEATFSERSPQNERSLWHRTRAFFAITNRDPPTNSYDNVGKPCIAVMLPANPSRPGV